jgi:hypothetical protein
MALPAAAPMSVLRVFLLEDLPPADARPSAPPTRAPRERVTEADVEGVALSPSPRGQVGADHEAGFRAQRVDEPHAYGGIERVAAAAVREAAVEAADAGKYGGAELAAQLKAGVEVDVAVVFRQVVARV